MKDSVDSARADSDLRLRRQITDEGTSDLPCVVKKQPSMPDILRKIVGWTGVSQHAKAPQTPVDGPEFTLAAPNESKQQKIPLYSFKYFQACTVGGILACGNQLSPAEQVVLLLQHVRHPTFLASE